MAPAIYTKIWNIFRLLHCYARLNFHLMLKRPANEYPAEAVIRDYSFGFAELSRLWQKRQQAMKIEPLCTDCRDITEAVNDIP